MSERILRLPEVKALSGLSRSTIYLRMAEGLFARAIALGPRMIGFRESEVAAVNAARIRGVSDEEVRALVASLFAARQGAA
jgi:prophage regulatory protein